MSARRCECGYAAADALDLQDHLQESFTPPDAVAPDGRVHDEGAEPGRCLCGFGGSSADDLDQHFLAVFTPPDHVGRDGRRHAVPARL